MHLTFTPYSPHFDPHEHRYAQTVDMSFKSDSIWLYPLHFPLVLLHHYLSIFHLIPISSQPYLVDQIGITINHYIVPLLTKFTSRTPNINSNSRSSSSISLSTKSQKILSMLSKASRSFYAGMIVRQIWRQPDQRPSLGSFSFIPPTPNPHENDRTTSSVPLSLSPIRTVSGSGSSFHLLAKPFWIWNGIKDSTLEKGLHHKGEVERGFGKPENIYTDLLLPNIQSEETISNLSHPSANFIPSFINDEKATKKSSISLDDIVSLIENDAQLIIQEIKPLRYSAKFRSQLRQDKILVGEKEHLSSSYINGDEKIWKSPNMMKLNNTKYRWEEIVLLKHGDLLNPLHVKEFFPQTLAILEKVNAFVEPYLKQQQDYLLNINENRKGRNEENEKMTTTTKPKLLFNAKFSILYPNTIIHPHCGPSNKRLRMHLTLTGIPNTGKTTEPTKNVKEGYIVVGNIKNENIWASNAEGKVTIFDDSFEHKIIYTSSMSASPKDEVRLTTDKEDLQPSNIEMCGNTTTQRSFSLERTGEESGQEESSISFHGARIVLIMDIWHPGLTVKDWVYQ